MTKSATKRTLLIFILAVCLTACLAFFVACGGDPQQTPGGNNPPPADDSVTYTVEVKLPDGGAAAGTTVSVGAAGVTFGNPVTVDDQGKAQFSLAAGDYDVTLDTLTEHYELPANAVLKLTETSTTLTVTLVRKFAYVVNLKAPNGEPLALDSVTVGICTMTGNCLNPVPAPNGTAFIEAAKGDYHVQILGLPAEYAYVSDDNGYYSGEDFSATKTEMTITVDAVNVIDITADYLTDAQKTELAKAIPAYNSDAQKYDAKHVTKTLAPGESAYYVISPRFSGKFTVYPDQTAGSYQNIGKHYKLENSAANLYTTADLSVELGEKQYIRAYNNGEQAVTASFVVTVPAASESVVTGVGALSNKTTTEVNITKAGAAAIIEFRPTSLGAYKLTVKDDVDAAIVMLAYNNGAFNAYANDGEGVFKKNPWVTYKATEIWADGQYGAFFAVFLPNIAKVPATLTVEIEKTDSFEHTTQVVAVQETLAQYTVPSGKELVGVPMDGSATLVYNNADKFYHLGAADGPVVVVMLTSIIDSNRFDFGYLNMGQTVSYPLAYLDKHPQAGVSYIFDLTPDEDIADLKKGNTYKDYSLMIRGFSKYDYDETNNPVIPDDITVQSYYTKYVNADGVYPLTKELETFLKDLVDVYGDSAFYFALPEDVEEKNLWLFPLYYYTDEVTEADVIVGEYKFVRHVLYGEETVVGGTKQGWDDETQQPIEVSITEDEYKLVVQKNGTCAVYSVDIDGNDVPEVTGSWNNNDGVYTFTLDGIEFAVTFNQAAGTIKLEEEVETWEFKLPDPDNA